MITLGPISLHQNVIVCYQYMTSRDGGDLGWYGTVTNVNCDDHTCTVSSRWSRPVIVPLSLILGVAPVEEHNKKIDHLDVVFGNLRSTKGWCGTYVFQRHKSTTIESRLRMPHKTTWPVEIRLNVLVPPVTQLTKTFVERTIAEFV